MTEEKSLAERLAERGVSSDVAGTTPDVTPNQAAEVDAPEVEGEQEMTPQAKAIAAMLAEFEEADTDEFLSMDFADLSREFATVNKERKDLEDEVKALSKRESLIEACLLQRMEREGIFNLKVKVGDAYRTVYLFSQLWMKKLSDDDAEIVQAFKDAGHGEFLKETWHSGTVSAWMRGLDMDDEELPILPPEFVDKIGASRKYSVRTRKAKG